MPDQIADFTDPRWKRLYRRGGIAALLYVVLAIVIPMTLVAALVSVGLQILFLA